tara:strand:+ start:1215 stop:1643 length:429 start_codon:yes stop_codon:yes gene_type:complete
MGGIHPQNAAQLNAQPTPMPQARQAFDPNAFYNSQSDKEKNLINYHRKHLEDKTFIEDNQGVTTLYETGFMGKDGKIHSVPGFVNGKRLTEKETKTYYEARPEILNKYPVYNSGQEANSAAQSRSSIKKYDLNQFKLSKMPK